MATHKAQLRKQHQALRRVHLCSHAKIRKCSNMFLVFLYYESWERLMQVFLSLNPTPSSLVMCILLDSWACLHRSAVNLSVLLTRADLGHQVRGTDLTSFQNLAGRGGLCTAAASFNTGFMGRISRLWELMQLIYFLNSSANLYKSTTCEAKVSSVQISPMFNL